MNGLLVYIPTVILHTPDSLTPAIDQINFRMKAMFA